jgi:hypothetical protein
MTQRMLATELLKRPLPIAKHLSLVTPSTPILYFIRNGPRLQDYYPIYSKNLHFIVFRARNIKGILAVVQYITHDIWNHSQTRRAILAQPPFNVAVRTALRTPTMKCISLSTLPFMPLCLKYWGYFTRYACVLQAFPRTSRKYYWETGSVAIETSNPFFSTVCRYCCYQAPVLDKGVASVAAVVVVVAATAAVVAVVVAAIAVVVVAATAVVAVAAVAVAIHYCVDCSPLDKAVGMDRSYVPAAKLAVPLHSTQVERSR